MSQESTEILDLLTSIKILQIPSGKLALVSLMKLPDLTCCIINEWTQRENNLHFNWNIRVLLSSESGEVCDVENINVPPTEACRFVPDETGNERIISSLMSEFYEMPSIHSFCNDENHQIIYPTKHNVYCGYRSTWSVIRESLDWKAVVQPVTTFPNPTFSLFKKIEAPLVYYLIDSRIVPVWLEKQQTILIIQNDIWYCDMNSIVW